MDKNSISSSFDYYISKENLLKHNQLKRCLYNSRKYFQRKASNYLVLKQFFGLIFFVLPLILMVCLYNKGITNIESNIVIGTIPVIVSSGFLLLYSTFLLAWRVVSAIKNK